YASPVPRNRHAPARHLQRLPGSGVRDSRSLTGALRVCGGLQILPETSAMVCKKARGARGVRMASKRIGGELQQLTSLKPAFTLATGGPRDADARNSYPE